MPNAIKYNTSAETLALKKGNFWIGTGDVGKGPTSSTGYYNGITPPSGGYTIYLNKATGGPSIYTVTTEAQMVSLTNTIGAQSFTTSGQCINWFATQTDKMIFNIDYPGIVTSTLILNLDAGFTPSYPTTNDIWYDISGNNNHFTLYNGVGYNPNNNGYLSFDGANDYARSTNTIDFTSYDGIVVELVAKMNNANVNMIYEHTPNWNAYSGGWGLAMNDASDNNGQSNWHHMNWNLGSAVRNFNYVNHQSWSFYTDIMMRVNDPTGRIFYINGNQITLYSQAGGGGSTDTTSNNTWRFTNDYLYVGSRGGVSLFANANISSFKIYGIKLTQSQVTQNFNVMKGRFGI
jgi:hypothetical protein